MARIGSVVVERRSRETRAVAVAAARGAMLRLPAAPLLLPIFFHSHVHSAAGAMGLTSLLKKGFIDDFK